MLVHRFDGDACLKNSSIVRELIILQLKKERDMSQNVKLIYTAKVHTTGGREGGNSKSDDGRLEITHSMPGAPARGPILSNFSPPVGPRALKVQ